MEPWRGSLEDPHATTLLWIVGVLRGAHIPFQITGGLAARFYGATRPIADIDVDVPGSALPLLGQVLASHVVFGPQTYRDEYWDLDLLTVAHNGVTIDIGASDCRIFSAATRSWTSFAAEIDSAISFDLLGVRVPVVDAVALVTYKKCLNRDVDRLDVAAIEGTIRSLEEVS
jgi:hypothetical protein